MNRPLRVTVVAPYGVIGGAELWILSLLDVTDRLDTDAVLLADGPLRREFERRGVPCALRSTGRSVPELAGCAAWLARRLRAERPDVVLANGVKAATVAAPAARLCGVPCVWAKHDHSYDGALTRVLAAVTDVCVGTEPGLVAASLHPRAVEVPVPAPDGRPLPRGEARAELTRRGARLDGGERLLLTISRLVSYKGVDDAVQALARPGGQGWRLAAVGPDDPSDPGERARLTALAKRLGVADRVDFAGWVQDAWRLLPAADCVAVLTKPDGTGPGQEAFGGTAVEAMLNGVPVITTGPGSVAERVAGPADAPPGGIVVPPADPGAVADALGRLAHPEARASFGRAGLRRTAANPGPAECAALLARTLSEAAGLPGAGLRGTAPLSVVVTVGGGGRAARREPHVALGRDAGPGRGEEPVRDKDRGRGGERDGDRSRDVERDRDTDPGRDVERDVGEDHGQGMRPVQDAEGIGEPDRFLALTLPQLTVPGDEIVLVDHGPADGAAGERLAALASRDPRVRLLHRPGASRAAARDAGAGAAARELIVCADAECVPAPDWLDRLRAAAAEPEPAGVLSGVCRATGRGPLAGALAAAYPPPEELGGAPGPWRRAHRLLFGPGVSVPGGPTLAFTRRAWRDAGGFADRAEESTDVSFAGSAARAGHRCAVVGAAEVRRELRAPLRHAVAAAFREGRDVAREADRRRLVGWAVRAVAATVVTAPPVRGRREAGSAAGAVRARPARRVLWVPGVVAVARLSLPWARAARRGDPRVLPLVPGAVRALDVAWAAGVLRGLVERAGAGRRSRAGGDAEDVRPDGPRPTAGGTRPSYGTGMGDFPPGTGRSGRRPLPRSGDGGGER
ncbi:glycosyltransferase [Streptomyces sp. NPDC057386]|uniref:D-inositol 3-phosphate glycosyltransferase n=1 Tax=Streptomyces thermocoprophilus TaxID=78356 RepID=A0ABV5V7Z8_9ACTN